MSQWHKAVNRTELNSDFPYVCQLDGYTVAIYLLENEIYAIEDRCTHMDYPLSDGPIMNGEVMCIHHGARFCLKSGKALSPPAFDNLTTFATKVEDGVVYVEI